MIDRTEVWRQRTWIWWLPVLFVALNVGIIVFFQTAFAGQLDVLNDRFDQQAQQLEEYREEREKIEEFLNQVNSQEVRTGELYRDYFATKQTRHLTALQEIRNLARRAGLDPTSFSYPETELEDYDLNKLGIQFTVAGTYDQLRTFINFLEVTDQFLALEAVSLAGGEGTRDAALKIGLVVSTIFAQDDAEQLEIDPNDLLATAVQESLGAAGTESLDESTAQGVERVSPDGAVGAGEVSDPGTRDEEEET